MPSFPKRVELARERQIRAYRKVRGLCQFCNQPAALGILCARHRLEKRALEHAARFGPNRDAVLRRCREAQRRYRQRQEAAA